MTTVRVEMAASDLFTVQYATISDEVVELDRRIDSLSQQIDQLEAERGDLERRYDGLKLLEWRSSREENAQDLRERMIVVKVEPTAAMLTIMEADKSGWTWDDWLREHATFVKLAEAEAEAVAMAANGLTEKDL